MFQESKACTSSKWRWTGPSSSVWDVKTSLQLPLSVVGGWILLASESFPKRCRNLLELLVSGVTRLARRPPFVNGVDSVELELRMSEEKNWNSEHFSRNKNVFPFT